MSERKPLTTLHNGCSARQTVRRTYGRKGKASVAAGSQNFLIAMDELQDKMGGVRIYDTKDDCEKENHGSTRTHKVAALDTEVENQPSRLVGISEETSTRKSKSVKAKRNAKRESGSQDTEAISKFIKEYSDRGMTNFRNYGKSIGENYNVEKIGEGAYSSVFALTCKSVLKADMDAETEHGHRTTIIKLMPISLPSKGEQAGMTDVSLIANELQTLKAMDPIHGFIRYRGLLVVSGEWPDNFVEAFRRFMVTNKTDAYNEDPETAFDSDQKYAVIEMEDAGKEVNDLQRPSDFQIYDIFWSTCIHLANSEAQVQFEHRDMHVSNICMKPWDFTDDRIDVDECSVRNMRAIPDTILGMSNIATTIIDYTYSRVQPSKDPKGPVIFRPAILSDNEYDDVSKDFAKKRSGEKRDDFETRGQDLTYSKVIKCVHLEYDQEYDPIYKDTNPAVWSIHVPKTNVCWLGYILTVLLQRAGKISRTKYVAGSNDVAKQLQDEIRAKMTALKECLMERNIDEIPESASDVVRIGVEKGWLKKEEIEAFKARLEQDSE